MASVAVTSRSFSRHPVLRAELLERYGHVRFNDEGVELRDATLVSFLRGCERAITALEPIDEAILGQLPELRVISKVGVGIDMLDLDAMRAHGVRLAASGGTNARSVAELVIGMVICALRHIAELDAEIRRGGWRQPAGRLLGDRTVGIVGFGAVGRELARLLVPFRCSIYAFDVVPVEDTLDNVRQSELDELLARSEIVSLHLPLTDDTHQIIDVRRLSLMHPEALLVNTARGALVDEDALYESLSQGRLGGACLDVFSSEAPVHSPLLALPNVVLTPHIGGSTEEAILAMGRAAIAGLESAAPIPES